MKMSGPGGILTILGALIVVFAALHHFVFAKSFLTFNHASIIVAVVGVVVGAIGVVLSMGGSSGK
jgi:hypothetical protein